MTRQGQRDPRDVMADASSGLSVLGVLFMLLAGFPVVYSRVNYSRGRMPQFMAIVTTVLLVAPGAWYVLAAVLLRRLHFWVIPYCVRAAVAQIVIVLLTIGFGLIADRFISEEFIIPAFLTLFFIPALMACIRAIRKAERVAHLMIPEGYAFEPIKPLRVETLPPAQDSDGEPSTLFESSGGDDGPAQQG